MERKEGKGKEIGEEERGRDGVTDYELKMSLCCIVRRRQRCTQVMNQTGAGNGYDRCAWINHERETSPDEGPKIVLTDKRKCE